MKKKVQKVQKWQPVSTSDRLTGQKIYIGISGELGDLILKSNLDDAESDEDLKEVEKIILLASAAPELLDVARRFKAMLLQIMINRSLSAKEIDDIHAVSAAIRKAKM